MFAFNVPPGALEGRAIAVIIMSGFAALWMVSGVNILRRLNWSTALLIALLTGALCWGAARELHASQIAAPVMPHTGTQSGSHVQNQPPPGWTPATRRDFQWVLALEWVPIVVVAIVFARMRRRHLILPAIAIIVGLHFLPLAKLFGAPLYYFTGSALVLATLAAFSVSDITRRQGIICFASGLILWTTSAILLFY